VMNEGTKLMAPSKVASATWLSVTLGATVAVEGGAQTSPLLNGPGYRIGFRQTFPWLG
jgi:hypothetical protein